jgi:hypothetical protein
MKKVLKVLLIVPLIVFSVWIPQWIFAPLKPWGDFEVVVRFLSLACAGLVGFFYADFIHGGNR